ncbi:TetR/AcrR family transcriptional regulator [Streptosporangium lutulentum]|uniref:AcrR family transcriptional regulator n=1 Tax=Streptosporangium lutulentum TaxID=1461250 RepID=A0ABT9Q7N8_9ACTN|nr:TetR/AcrR family transcriptional regulator [Streptosporangium lutulentum]MDP9842677.1 AcrR family transcriptional regulator [Streptosporangium lutulentum]
MATRPGPRERLLEAAHDLTYAQGVHVGVDAILKQADVARRSLYQHFGGKDGLVAEVLHTAVGEARYRQVMDGAGDDPRRRVLAVFDELEKITTRPSFRGCRYTAAELALTDPAHPAHKEIRTYKDGLHEIFTAELTRHGHPAPHLGADQLLVLIDGALAHAVTRPDAHPALAARAMAEFVLDHQPQA